jgi:hypothetical protein
MTDMLTRNLVVTQVENDPDVYDFKHSYAILDGGVLVIKTTLGVVMTYSPNRWSQVYWKEDARPC